MKRSLIWKTKMCRKWPISPLSFSQLGIIWTSDFPVSRSHVWISARRRWLSVCNLSSQKGAFEHSSDSAEQADEDGVRLSLSTGQRFLHLPLKLCWQERMLTFRCAEAWNEYKKKKVMMSDQRAVIFEAPHPEEDTVLQWKSKSQEYRWNFKCAITALF